MGQDEEREFWLRRLEATGRAQARYLWLTLIACLFFAALRARSPSAFTIKVPVLDLELDVYTVLASGGPAIAFLVLAGLGAIRAWTHALEQVRDESPARSAEPLDSFPNAIDLATYTTSRSPRLVRHLLSFSYPLYLAAALAESAWLAYSVAFGPTPIARRPVYLGVMAVLWLPAAFLLMIMWGHRLRDLFGRNSAGSQETSHRDD